MSDTLTPEQARAEMAKLQGKGLDNVMKNTLRRGARRVREGGIKDIATKGPGRRIWGKKPKGLRKQVVMSKVQQNGPAAFEIEIDVKGIPGHMETGGRTAPHRIKAQRRGPKGKRLLSFRAAGGTGAVPEVQHPGGRVNRDPSVEPRLEREAPQIERELVAAVDVFGGFV